MTDNLEKFLDLAIDQVDLVSSLSTGVAGFCLFVILQFWGLKKNELELTPKLFWPLFVALLSSCLSILLGFAVRMMAVGHYYELGAKRVPLNWDDVASLGLWATILATTQMFLALAGLSFLIGWVILNRKTSQVGAEKSKDTK